MNLKYLCYQLIDIIIPIRAGEEMDEYEMFMLSFDRPSNFFKLSEEQQWDIDKKLGILDWKGEGLSDEEKIKFYSHYDD